MIGLQNRAVHCLDLAWISRVALCHDRRASTSSDRSEQANSLRRHHFAGLTRFPICAGKAHTMEAEERASLYSCCMRQTLQSVNASFQSGLEVDGEGEGARRTIAAVP